MKWKHDLQIVFSMFFKLAAKAKRTRYLFLFSLLPVLTLVILKIYEFSRLHSQTVSSNYFFIYGSLTIQFQFFVPIFALFFGTSIVTDEVENRTLIFLTTTPVSKATILLGKFLSVSVITAAITLFGFLITYFIVFFSQLGTPQMWVNILRYLFATILALLAYLSVFTLMGILMRKPVIFGLIFIFGYERVVQFFPGSTQKLTIFHYVKSLLPSFPESNQMLAFNIPPSSFALSIATLLGISIIALILSVWLFRKKEFIAATGDGS